MKEATACSACFMEERSLVTDVSAVCMLSIIGITPGKSPAPPPFRVSVLLSLTNPRLSSTTWVDNCVDAAVETVALRS